MPRIKRPEPSGTDPDTADENQTFLFPKNENPPAQNTDNIEEDPRDITFTGKAKEWLLRANQENLDYTCTVYKFKTGNQGGGKQCCGQWTNEIPDENTIGNSFGGGKYLVLITYPRGLNQLPGVKKYVFELHDNYTNLARENTMFGKLPIRINKQENALPAVPGNGGGSKYGELLEVLSILLPILRPAENTNNTFQQMLAMYQMTGAIMKKSLLDNADFLADYQERILEKFSGTPNIEGPEEMETETPSLPAEKPSFIDKYLPLFMPFIEKLAGNNPGQAQATAAAIQAMPAIKEIITNPAYKTDCQKLIAYMDKNLKPEKTDEILKMLKVDRGNYK